MEWVAVLAIGTLCTAIGAVGALLYRELKDWEQGYPYEAEIEAAVLPYVFRAILMAYKVSEGFVDIGQDRLRGIDKRALANKVYDMLPPAISVGGLVVDTEWIKSVVTRERFERWVEAIFDRFLTWYEDVQDKYGQELEKMLGLDEVALTL